MPRSINAHNFEDGSPLLVPIPVVPPTGPDPQTSAGTQRPPNSRKRNSNQIPSDKKRGFPPKRPFPSKQQNKTDSTPIQANLEPTTPVVPYFPVKFGFDGIHNLIPRYFSYLRGKDAKLADAVSLPLLQYVTFLTIFARVKAVRAQCALEFYPNVLTITSIASSIRLPSFLAKYVESIGLVKLANGATICPSLPSDDDIEEFIKDIFDAADREFQLIDSNWVVQYCDAIGRHEKTGVKFEPVSFATPLNGREEFLVSYEEENEPAFGISRTKAFCPQVLSGAIADLGALYHFRSREEANGLVAPLFEGVHFVEDAMLSNLLR